MSQPARKGDHTPGQGAGAVIAISGPTVTVTVTVLADAVSFSLASAHLLKPELAGSHS